MTKAKHLVTAGFGVESMIETWYHGTDKATPGMVREHRQFSGASPHHRVTGRD
jgi:hypothetical protein